MGFNRKVLSPSGIIYSYHAISHITHDFDNNNTVITIGSTQNEAAYNAHTEAHWTNLVRDLSIGMTEEQAYEIAKASELFEEYNETTNNETIEELADMLTDEQAATMPQIYPEWQVDTFYEAGKRLQYKGGLYRVLQSHTSQASWLPTEVSAVYAEILPGQDGNSGAEEGQLSEWVQPESTNPYMKTDQVTHNGKDWESDYDNNVWEPGIFGWHEI